MDHLKNTLLSSSSFDELTKYLTQREILLLAKDLLSLHNLSKIKVREFLSAFLLYRFPIEVLGPNKIEEEKELCLATKALIESSESQLFPVLVQEFIAHLERWRARDRNEFINSLFFSYHELTVNILNSPPEAEEYLRECQVEILNCAQKIGGTSLVNQILSYAPVLLNLDQLEKNYTQAFWDLLDEKMKVKDFELLLELLSQIRDSLVTFFPSRKELIEDIIDPPLIGQRLRHDAYTLEELNLLNLNILKIVEEIQAPIHDSETKTLKERIFRGEISFLQGLREIVSGLKRITAEIENLRLRSRID